MRDLIFILLTVGFFALTYAYIAGCARVVGRDPAAAEPSDDAGPRAQASG